jgi:hypothetical protein
VHGDISNFDPSLPLAGRSIYPDGKQSLLAQAFLASENACNPDGVNNTNSAVINGAPCMPVLTNSQAGYPAGLKKYHVARCRGPRGQVFVRGVEMRSTRSLLTRHPSSRCSAVIRR